MKMPCAVSGLRKALNSPVGPICVGNIRLKATGSLRSFLVMGDLSAYFVMTSCISRSEKPSRRARMSLSSLFVASAVFLLYKRIELML